MTTKFYVEWIPSKIKPKHIDVNHYEEHMLTDEQKEILPYFELKEEYSEDFKYQEEVIRSILLIDGKYYFASAVLPYIENSKNINLREIENGNKL